ncbi:MAG: hypothetical protein IIC24_06715, partial [Chloroflexi bacterium]|nr:hypothetical protein [Chloroflexota bacterium]
VLVGHIHRRQILTRSSEDRNFPVIYSGSVERTSFAEMDEQKGFYDITFAPDEGGTWRVRETNFHELPTRPMVDLEIGPEIRFSGLTAFLQGHVANMDENSIVRLRRTGQLDESVRERLSASFLRSVFPPTMSVQVGVEFYRRDRQETDSSSDREDD